jgi:hypothetical protein
MPKITLDVTECHESENLCVTEHLPCNRTVLLVIAFTTAARGLGKCTPGAQGPTSPVLEAYRRRQYKTHCTTDDATELTEVINRYLGERHAYSMTAAMTPSLTMEKAFLASIRLLHPAK